MIVFGLTGGIACGKSTVTKTFRTNGIPLIDADIVARQVVQVGSRGYFKLLKAFGPEFFLEDGSLDRAKLGNLVFTEQAAMNKLNKIMEPLIDEEVCQQQYRWHDYLLDNGKPLLLGYDAALICEMKKDKYYRPLIVVSCPREIQLERLMKRNSLTREQAEARINAQMPNEEKVKLADYVIDTSKEIEYSIQQTEDIIKKLQALVPKSF